MDKYWDDYPQLKKDLQEVKKLMIKSVRCRDKVIENALLDLINSGGKLLRPAFVLLSAGFGSYDQEKAITMAAVIEMLHMATLVHDDIIDDAKLRRGQETIQSRYGKNYAVYMGDFLFCQCFKLLSENSSLKNINIDSNAMSRICVGEIEQFNSHFNKNVSIKQYLKRISAKTAELFSLSFYTGAAESGCKASLCRDLSSLGHNIGMAFQIIDDVLDYCGSDESVKKTTGNDIKQGIFTLPLLYALKQGNEELCAILNNPPYSDAHIARVIELTLESGAIYKSRELAKKYTDRAFSRINKLPQCENKEILIAITGKLLNRAY